MRPASSRSVGLVSHAHPATHTSSVHYRRIGQRGVSLVELSVVVTITGILATLATYSVRERIYEAHSLEALAMLGSIRSGLLAKSDDLTGNSAAVLQVGGRVGGFGGPLGLPGVLGGIETDNGGGNTGDIDGDGNRGHGNNEGRCDPDNPGAKGGADCGGDGDDSGGDGSSGGGDDPGGGNSSGSGSSGSGSGSSGSGETGVGGELALCSSATPVPATFDYVKGSAYQSRPSEWQADDSGGWSCLHVSMSAAQRFQYGYDLGTTAVPTGVLPAGADSTFAAWARGDLDGDGRTSWFVLSGASVGGHVVIAPALSIIDQGE